MAKVFRFSTYGAASAANARLALDRSFDLAPIADKLRAHGYLPEPGERGHLWGAKETGFIWRNPQRRLESGDHGARMTVQNGQVVVSHVYEVLAALEDPEVPRELIGSEWGGADAAGWPVSIVFAPPLELDPGVNYEVIRAQLGWQQLSTPPPAYFVPSDVDQTLLTLQRLARVDAVEPSGRRTALRIFDERSEATFRRQRSRPGQRQFKVAVMTRYGAACGACDVTGTRLLEAAHLVDEGWSDSDAEFGMPLCPNHHRLLDKGILRVRGASWECADREYSHTVTRTSWEHLAASPAPEALAWKAAHPVAGRLRGRAAR